MFIPNNDEILSISDSFKSTFIFVDPLVDSINYCSDEIQLCNQQISLLSSDDYVYGETVGGIDISENFGLYIDLSKTTGKYNYGQGKVKFLDISWYFKYKNLVDSIIGSFIYIAYGYLLFKRIPDIIAGSSVYTEHVNYDRVINYSDQYIDSSKSITRR